MFSLFSIWLDNILEQDMPNGIKAFNFNIYEGSEGTYDIELIGSNEYTEDDDDWACSDYFTTTNNMFFIKRTLNLIKSENGLKYIKDLIEKYLNNGKYAYLLKSVSTITVGFVDGDLTIINKTS